MNESGYKVGIDLGGTKIEIAVLDSNANFVLRERLATPQGDYAATLDTIAQLVHHAEKVTGRFDRIGVAIPGAVSSQTDRIKNANSVCLIGQDLKGDLHALLGKEIHLENDANCFVLSEAKDGAALGHSAVFGVIIGTGCGGGLVINGQVLRGANAIGGEWGHNPLPWAESKDECLPCYCGKTGCIETFLSGPGLSQHLHLRHNLNWTPVALVDQAQQGNPKAIAMMEAYAIWLAKGLSSVINIIDPDVIVLGGGLSNMQYLYQRVPEIWGQWIFSDQIHTQLCAPRWGDSSGVRGAAWLTETNS